MQGSVEHHKDALRLTELACNGIPDLPPDRLSRRPAICLQLLRRTPAVASGYLLLPAGDQRIDLVSRSEADELRVFVAGPQCKCGVNRPEAILRAACCLPTFQDLVLE